MGQKVITLPEHLVMLPSFFLSDFVLYLDRTLLGKLFGWFGLAYGVLTPLSTIFQLYRGDQFYCWGKPQCPGKIADLSQVTDKLCDCMVVGFYSYLCNQCLAPLKLRGRIPFMVRCARYNIM
jgi:hypothetical protein